MKLDVRRGGVRPRLATLRGVMAAALMFVGCVPPPRPPEPAEPVVIRPPPLDPVARPAPRRPDSLLVGDPPPVPALSLRADAGPVLRVAITAPAPGTGVVSGSGAWGLYGGDGANVLVRGTSADAWRVERNGGTLRAVRADGLTTMPSHGPLIARPLDSGSTVSWNGRRFRGELVFHAADSGLVVVNRLQMEDYLRGVVPLEIGNRTPEERAAVEAQAIAARSFAYIRLGNGRTVEYDLVSTVMDQVYGGVEVERAVSDEAVARTAGLVLWYAGRVVNAPYHSTCGGTTAEAPEVWRSRGEPYLRRVSDRIPGTGRHYCDISPRFSWTRTFDAPQLAAALNTYLRQYAAVPAGGPGTARSVETSGTTPSGRVAALTIVTDRGRFTLRANDIRFVLRAPGGEILNSTYFSLSQARDRGGAVSRITIRGNGYGHGIGMCQWGAIGRARAGQDVATILGTYYPGTRIAPAP